MFEDCLLTIKNGSWVLVIASTEITLDPISMPLDCIANAIEQVYENLWVHFDPEISENVWYQRHAEQELRGIVRPNLAMLEQEFSNTESRKCSACGAKTYFNAEAKNWQCPRCYMTRILR